MLSTHSNKEDFEGGRQETEAKNITEAWPLSSHKSTAQLAIPSCRSVKTPVKPVQLLELKGNTIHLTRSIDFHISPQESISQAESRFAGKTDKVQKIAVFHFFLRLRILGVKPQALGDNDTKTQYYLQRKITASRLLQMLLCGVSLAALIKVSRKQEVQIF